MCYYFSKSRLACGGEEFSPPADAAEEKNDEMSGKERDGAVLEGEKCMDSLKPERKCA